jgi:hypothetical protein
MIRQSIAGKYWRQILFFAADDTSIFTCGFAVHAQSLHAHSVHAHAAQAQIARSPDAYILRAVYSIITRLCDLIATCQLPLWQLNRFFVEGSQFKYYSWHLVFKITLHCPIKQCHSKTV